MKIDDMIKVMKHYADGGEVEAGIKNSKLWSDCNYPEWNWNSMDYRIKEQKQKVTIEKWLMLDTSGDYIVFETSDVTTLNGYEAIKLLETYEVEI